jgi:hypothetical protein
MAVMIMKKKVEEIEPMDAGVRVRRGAPQYYKGKEKAEAQKPMASGSSAYKPVDLKSNEPQELSLKEKIALASKKSDLRNSIKDRMDAVKKYSEEVPERYKKPEMKLSDKEVEKVSNIKFYPRATRVLDRMKKRKGMGNSRMMD